MKTKTISLQAIISSKYSRITLFAFALFFYSNTRIQAQGLETVGGNNRWVFHVPTTNNNMYIAPYISGSWRWDRQTSFYSNGNVVFSANVGVGTSNLTGFRLSVNGNIRARELVLESVNWPDYVFSDEYNLASLSEVKSFIQQHKHLPDIPSAQEIEKGGVPVGEIERKLLQKVEELTLYVIAQEEKMQRMETELQQLKQDADPGKEWE